MKKIDSRYYKPVFSTCHFIGWLLVVHVLWHAGMVEDISLSGSKIITCFGYDVTSFFQFFTQGVVASVKWLLSTISNVAFEVKGSSFSLTEQEQSIGIVWSCTGIKQAIFFIVVVLLYPSNWLKKLWFIPAGLVAIFIINICRITGIIWICSADISNFDTLHELSKYVFYAILFGMWILWDWKIADEPNR